MMRRVILFWLLSRPGYAGNKTATLDGRRRLFQLSADYIAKVFPRPDLTTAPIIEVKAFKSKAQERHEIEQQTLLFLKQGGEVISVERGASGAAIGSPKLAPGSFSTGGNSERTPVTNEIRAIEARRQSLRQSKKKLAPKRGPRRILIKDDFGEPLRWSWKE